MTIPDLITLRRDYALGSTVRLAERIGCHPSTINRNIQRGHVTPYVRACIDNTPTAAAFLRGYEWGRDEACLSERGLYESSI
jgi:hypothetical protein